MRAYIPISSADLRSLVDRNSARISKLFIPSRNLAEEYGVFESEEIEYAALEGARTSAEQEKLSLILAVEVTDEPAENQSETAAGVLEGEIEFSWADVAAIYIITGEDEELEWYDETEVALCLSKVSP